jgi:hypothetical protein
MKDESFLERLHPAFRFPGGTDPNVAYFLARRGGEGERWVKEYTRPRHVELMARSNRALQALRARRMREGHRDLKVVERLFQKAGNTTARSVHHILGRWYYGLLAYALYCAEDFPGAEIALDQGHEEVRQAIGIERFLLPYAMECYDFWLQRIRIARNQRRWPEVWRRIEIARQIAYGERPCCVLSDGTTVDVLAVQEFYAGFEALTDLERRAVRRVLEPEIRSRHFRSILSEVYTPPGFVIAYTPDPDPG